MTIRSLWSIKISICLATVTSQSFIPATLVMLYSFQKHNPWFKGKFILIHDDLTENDKGVITTCFKQTQFLSVSASLKTAVSKLLLTRPDLHPIHARFYSLEVFRITDMDKVIFYDSDVIFQASIEEVLEKEGKLLCCGERLFYKNACRDPVTLAALPANECQQSMVLTKTFNAGFMLIDKYFLKPKHYGSLLELLTPDLWETLKPRMTDQAIYNLYFADQHTLLEAEYNYLFAYRTDIYNKEKSTYREAKALHFCGPMKPWLTEKILFSVEKDIDIIQTTQLWYACYMEVLKIIHLNSHIQQLKHRVLP